MDLSSVRTFRQARRRGDLVLAPGERLLGGGTWLFSEPQPGTTGLVDLTTLGWVPAESLPGGGLRIAATCTVEQLQQLPWTDHHPSLGPLVRSCVDAFLLSFKIAHTATVGGNVCLALPAGAMTSMLAGLGAQAVVWTPDGGVRREPVAELVTGVRTTSLRPGEVLRALDVPAESLAAPALIRRASLATRGRSGAVVVGRRDGDAVVLTLSASTTRPVVLRLPAGVAPEEVRAAVAGVTTWYDDPHGAPDWRAAMTARLAVEVADRLSAEETG